MPAYLSLVILEIFITAEAEPICFSNSSIFIIFITCCYVIIQRTKLFLKINNIFLYIIFVNLFVQKHVNFMDFIPNIYDLLVIVIFRSYLLLQISYKSKQMISLVMKLMIEIFFHFLDIFATLPIGFAITFRNIFSFNFIFHRINFA